MSSFKNWTASSRRARRTLPNSSQKPASSVIISLVRIKNERKGNTKIFESAAFSVILTLLLSTTAMLNHQAEFGIILQDIYDPSIGMPAGEVTPRRTPTAPESVQAVDDFQATMRETRDILLPLVVWFWSLIFFLSPFALRCSCYAEYWTLPFFRRLWKYF